MVFNKCAYVLTLLFGSSSWIGINSIWMELPILIKDLPEKWTMPTNIAFVVQVACIGLLIYTVLHKCLNIKISQNHAISFLLVICSFSVLLLSFYWNDTKVVFKREYSVALIILTFIIALVNSTSNVLFMPYIALFYPLYLKAYFVGMGFSAFVPSLVSLIQGFDYKCEKHPSGQSAYIQPTFFGVKIYFFVIFLWMCLSTGSFIALNYFYKIEETENNEENKVEINELRPLQEGQENAQNAENQKKSRYLMLIVFLSFVCAQMSSIVPSSQSYASIPYSLKTYRLALFITNLIQPFMSFLPYWIKTKKLIFIWYFTCLTTFFTGVVVYLASQSPNPPMKDFIWGQLISILSSVLSGSLCVYLRTLITTVIKEDTPHNESRLFWCGFAMQIGPFFSACIMLLLINEFGIFKDASICS